MFQKLRNHETSSESLKKRWCYSGINDIPTQYLIFSSQVLD